VTTSRSHRKFVPPLPNECRHSFGEKSLELLFTTNASIRREETKQNQQLDPLELHLNYL